jgi:hypothetical protein
MHLHGFYFQVYGVGDQDHFQEFARQEQLTVVTQEMLPGATRRLPRSPAWDEKAGLPRDA